VKQAHANAISIAAETTRNSQLPFVAKSNHVAKTVNTTPKKSFIVDRCCIMLLQIGRENHGRIIYRPVIKNDSRRDSRAELAF
jgi:hypothetical protein